MKSLTHKELRKKWFNYWENKRKHYHPSDFSLLNSDPSDSLLWINSGVAALKNIFTSSSKPEHSRLCNIQPAVRTDDLDLIGKTNRHLSLFEMMGNFSLGDYGKKEAIEWAWEFLTHPKWLGLDKEKLYITVFKGDQESIDVCRQNLQITPDHLFLKGLKTNFWDLGVGPCGPNLEFFYDLGPDFEISEQKKGLLLLKNDEENDRYLEIWNIVFSELFNKKKMNFFSPDVEAKKIIYEGLDERWYVNLPRKNIDTGMGFERILMVLQGKKNPFETDLFMPIINDLEKETGIKFVIDQFDYQLTSQQLGNNRRFKIIADHVRSIIFMLIDLLHGDTDWTFQQKHGYVVRQIIRNVSLQGYFLGIKKPFLYKQASHPEKPFFKILGNEYQRIFPLKKLDSYIYDEEKRFLEILENVDNKQFLNSSKERIWTGQEIFRLVTESGFPFSFLKTIAQEKGFSFGDTEHEQYQQEILNHKTKSKGTRFKTWIKYESILVSASAPPTDFKENTSTIKKVKILGIFPDWSYSDHPGNPQELYVGDVVDTLSKGDTGWVIFDKTPFYGRRGGQEPDIGTFTSDEARGEIFEVIINDLDQYVHHVKVREGHLWLNRFVDLKINEQNRKLTAKNHSATHLLHAILRNQVHESVRQSGSLNNSDYLRLDFFTIIDSKEEIYFRILDLEKTFLNKIKEKIKTSIKFMSQDEARKQKVLDFFDVSRFYKDKLRVVQFGQYSKECCGGTHVQSTSDIKHFVITDFKKIGRNMYRIYARTHDKAELIKEKQFENFEKKLDLQSQVVKLFLRETYNDLDLSRSNEDIWKDLFIKEFIIKQKDNGFLVPKYETNYFYRQDLFKTISAKFKVFKRKTISANLDALVNIYDFSVTVSLKEFFTHSINFHEHLDSNKFLEITKRKDWIYSDRTKKNLFASNDFDRWLFLHKLFDRLKTERLTFFLCANWKENNWIFMMKIDEQSIAEWKRYFDDHPYKPNLQCTIKDNKVKGAFRSDFFGIFVKEIQKQNKRIQNQKIFL